MNVLWDHLHVGRLEPLPCYELTEHTRSGSVVAQWKGDEFDDWKVSPDGDMLRLAWSPPASPSHWAAVVKKLLEEPVSFSTFGGDISTDAIVCYAWTGDMLQVAVARTPLGEQPGGAPEWYLTGRKPKPPGMKLSTVDKWLMVQGRAMPFLWEFETEAGTGLVWPKNGVHGVLASPFPYHPTVNPFGTNRSIATGKVTPADVGAGHITVTTPVVTTRKGMSLHKGPEGFVRRELLVMNEDGTCSMEAVWVGDRLDLEPDGGATKAETRPGPA